MGLLPLLPEPPPDSALPSRKVLPAAGANVVLAARRTDRLAAVEAKIRQSGANVMSVKCDVTNAAQVEFAVTTACDHFGRVDILVNNAGHAADGVAAPENLPNELFNQTMATNLSGTWYCCREVGRRMLADGQGGSIINIASIAGLAGVADLPLAYQASKAAVINLTRSLAVSWAERGIRVNALAPGWFPSELTDDLLGQSGIPRLGRRWRRDEAPRQSAGTGWPALVLSFGRVELRNGPNASGRRRHIGSDRRKSPTGELHEVEGAAVADGEEDRSREVVGSGGLESVRFYRLGWMPLIIL